MLYIRKPSRRCTSSPIWNREAASTALHPLLHAHLFTCVQSLLCVYMYAHMFILYPQAAAATSSGTAQVLSLIGTTLCVVYCYAYVVTHRHRHSRSYCHPYPTAVVAIAAFAVRYRGSVGVVTIAIAIRCR